MSKKKEMIEAPLQAGDEIYFCLNCEAIFEVPPDREGVNCPQCGTNELKQVK